MSNGFIRGADRIPSATSASGLWTPDDIMRARDKRAWPNMTYYASGTLAEIMDFAAAAPTLTNATWNIDGGIALDVEYQTIAGNTTLSVNTDVGSATPDTRTTCIRYDGDLTIGSGVTLTTPVRKRGLFILVKGNLTVSGKISMTARGANGGTIPGGPIHLFGKYYWPTTGAPQVFSYARSKGRNGTEGEPGGGGMGGGWNVAGHPGAAGSTWSGGSGAGGAGNNQGTAPVANGGSGGHGGTHPSDGGGSGGGAGNPGGNPGSYSGGTNGQAGSTGTGGQLVVIVEGNITINAGGAIESKGSNGGNGGTPYGIAGSGSGGGAILLGHTGTFTNSGTVDTSGGAGGTGYSSGAVGGTGGKGSQRIIKISSEYYEDIKNLIQFAAIGLRTVTINGAHLPVDIYDYGATVISTNTNLGTATDDDAMVVARYSGNLTVNSGITLTAASRKRGCVIYVNGDLNVQGGISMTARGAKAPGVLVTILTSSGITYSIPARGGAGATSVPGGSVGQPGTAGAAGSTGGGGGGHGGSDGTYGYGGGAGSAGTSFSGGSGGAGGPYSNGGEQGGHAEGDGGAGGAATIGTTAGGGGGAGNPGGAGAGASTPQPGSNGTGGLLIIMVTGTVSIGASGVIQADGTQGGGGNAGSGGGGGSGGGSINIFHVGSLTNGGVIRANGGAGGTSNTGGAGGNGTVRTAQVTL